MNKVLLIRTFKSRIYIMEKNFRIRIGILQSDSCVTLSLSNRIRVSLE